MGFVAAFSAQQLDEVFAVVVMADDGDGGGAGCLGRCSWSGFSSLSFYTVSRHLTEAGFCPGHHEGVSVS
jgi:hypothetical protein